MKLDAMQFIMDRQLKPLYHFKNKEIPMPKKVKWIDWINDYCDDSSFNDNYDGPIKTRKYWDRVLDTWRGVDYTGESDDSHKVVVGW